MALSVSSGSDDSEEDGVALCASSGCDEEDDHGSLLHEHGDDCCSPDSKSSARSLLASGDDMESCESCGFMEGDGGVSPLHVGCVFPLHDGGISPSAAAALGTPGGHGGVSPSASIHGGSTWDHLEHDEAIWSEATSASLTSTQQSTLQQNASLRKDGYLVGSDCSGCDAVWEALGALSVRWRHSALGCHVSFKKEFCSEHPGTEGDVPRNFLYLNSKPRVMFRDMCRRAEEGFCSYQKRCVASPKVDLYSSGWVCKDVSNANTLSRKPVTMDLTETSGQSTRTLHAGIEYIRSRRPLVAVLENTVRKNSIAVAVSLLHRVAGYAVVALKANSLSFATCASRPRIYIVAVNLNEVTITTPLREWPALLDAMSALMPEVPLQNVLLADDHPDVRQYFRELELATSNKGWERCKKLHKLVRKGFLRKYGESVSGVGELREEVLRRRGSHGLALLSPRQLDAYGLHVLAAKVVLGLDVEKQDMVLDVTNNVTMAAGKDVSRGGTMPCLLRAHQYVHTMRRRPICGSERMRIQGFTRPLILSGTDSDGFPVQISQRDLCLLAGDTMSVPVVGALLAVIFTCCLFKAPLEAGTVEDAELGLPAEGTWVGRHRSGKRPGTVADKLPMASSHGSSMSEEAVSEVESLL